MLLITKMGSLGSFTLDSSYLKAVVAEREAEARTCRRKNLLAMSCMQSLAVTGLIVLTRGRILEATFGSRALRALKVDNPISLSYLIE